jgi:D-alanyl-D-alanine carboxypeptidase
VLLTRRLALAGLLAAPALPAAARGGADITPEAAEAALTAAFDEKAPVALAGAIVTRDGIAWSGVRGMRRFGGADPATVQDRWHLGSNTKAMTAAVYARLVEQGRARWGATLPELFPDLTLDPAHAGATIEDLLHHRAGLSDQTAMGRDWLMTARADPAGLTDQRTAIAAKTLGAPPAGTPGAFAYANVNYVLAGAAVDRLAGPWEETIRAELFQPLGLASAGLYAPKGDNAWGHAPGSPPRPMDPAGVADNPVAGGPAGAVHMTLEDYGRFLRVFLKDGDGWLNPESIAHLTTPAAGEGRAYACGWGVETDRPWARGPQLGHEGSNVLWHALAMVAPGRGLAVIAVSNQGPTTGAGRALADRLTTLIGA